MTTARSLSLIGLLILSTACGARSTSNNVGNGSNTNWLSGCTTDDTCDDGVCASGACTETCRNDDDCGHLSPDAKCAEAVAFVGSSASPCDDVEPRRVCTPGCDDASECADIGDGYTCADGACVPATCASSPPTSACDGKACGDYCTPCPASDPQCEVDAIVYQCNAGGECVEGVLSCTDDDCAGLPPNECAENGCVVIAGQAITGECSERTSAPVGCAPFDSGDAAISCALSPDDSLCYRFPTTTTPSGWSTLNCEDVRCELPECPNDECFSPEQNVDRAYDGDIAGCPCDESQGDVCVGGVALVCADAVWQAAEDGPCYPIQTPCQGLLEDPYDCIGLFDTCAEQGTSFCGVTALTDACPLGVIVDDEATCASDATDCTQLDNGFWCASAIGSPDDECYSPTQNIDRAYDGDIPGCPCNQNQGDICFGETALMCYGGEWNAVIDGPCYLTESPCVGLIADATECITLFGNCDQEGEVFCGTSPLTDQCVNGVMVQSAIDCPTDAADCSPLDNGLWCASPLTSPCPEHYEQVRTCEPASNVCYVASPSITRQLRRLTMNDCTEVNGDTFNDPGDGSLLEQGCPSNYGSAVGFLYESAEGGLCCPPITADGGAPDGTLDAGPGE